MGLKELQTGSAASSQQVACGGFTAAEAARRPVECGYNELPENDCEDLRASRVLKSWKLMLMNQVFSSGFFLREVVC
jgi:hypothetical protein